MISDASQPSSIDTLTVLWKRPRHMIDKPYDLSCLFTPQKRRRRHWQTLPNLSTLDRFCTTDITTVTGASEARLYQILRLVVLYSPPVSSSLPMATGFFLFAVCIDLAGVFTASTISL